ALNSLHKLVALSMAFLDSRCSSCYQILQGTFATRSVWQQQELYYTKHSKCNFTVDLPSISPKDSSKNCKKNFSFNVARHILLDGSNKTPQENLFCSPVSTSAVLNMLIPGFTGLTRDQFVDLFCLKEKELNKSSMKLLDVVRPFKGGDGLSISFSNSVWVDQQCPLIQSYKELLENVHDADVKSVDLLYNAEEAKEEVNSWSRTKTEGMVETILPETLYYNDTIVILANALHFELENSDETLMDPSGAQRSLYYCGEFEGSEVLRMPIKGGKKIAEQDPRSFSIYILVPSEKTDLSNGRSLVGRRKISLSQFLEEMKMGTKDFQKKVNRHKKEISDFSFPTFNIESEMSLSSKMQHLGLTLPFQAGKNELIRFIDSPLSELLYVTDVTQKTRIETNARGTSFSVVTYTTLNGPAHRFPATTPSEQKFVADNPFLFMTQDDFSGAVVSVGTVLSTDL
uniref:Serpin domain-containing protein n=1 Tax=Chenopodium quinoa TaxID=63459 RepID=A0A803MXX3_CHEQI